MKLCDPKRVGSFHNEGQGSLRDEADGMAANGEDIGEWVPLTDHVFKASHFATVVSNGANHGNVSKLSMIVGG